ncbi:MAG TPA: DUF488 domain-containing protein [Egibacteraceae bacterium]|nr:DUF488 domain-containing protein [Egibacteraceae bacterium]
MQGDATGEVAAGALLTVGHGSLDVDAFAGLLEQAGVAAVVDVRRFPASRRHPHFARQALDERLAAQGIDYRWEEALGGRRTAQAHSVNVGLRDPGFRGYADYMGTAVFWAALDGVLVQARERRTSVLCAESVWWRCHRRLIADAAVLVRDHPVVHLFHDGRRQSHPPTPAARREGDRLVYDRGQDRALPALDHKTE